MAKLEQGGVPWNQIFTKVDSGKTTGIIHGDSGLELRYFVIDEPGHPYVFGVRDAADSDLVLKATAYPQKKSFEMIVRTKGYNGSPSLYHPDLHARSFPEKALTTFKVRKGIVPVVFAAEWQKYGDFTDNYALFQARYNQTLDPVDAARHTWTGEVMSDIGFTRISKGDIQLQPDKILVRFRRGKRLSQTSS